MSWQNWLFDGMCIFEVVCCIWKVTKASIQLWKMSMMYLFKVVMTSVNLWNRSISSLRYLPSCSTDILPGIKLSVGKFVNLDFWQECFVQPYPDLPLDARNPLSTGDRVHFPGNNSSIREAGHLTPQTVDF